MAQDYDDIDHDVDTVAEVLVKLDERTDTLLTCFVGATAPSSPVEGQLWLDISSTPYVLKQYGDHDGTGATWHVIMTPSVDASVDLQMNYKQLVEAVLEKRASAPTISPTTDGSIYLLTGVGEVELVDNTVSAVVKRLVSVIVGTTLDSIDIPLESVRLDATNPPTIGTKGTTPILRGWLFDNANERMLLAFRVPANFSGDGNLTLRLTCVLNQAETSGDDIDWQADLVSVADGESVTGTSTQTAQSDTDIGANNAEGDLHECDLVLDFDDATNPLAAGDWVFAEIFRPDLAEVGGVILLKATLYYPVQAGTQ